MRALEKLSKSVRLPARLSLRTVLLAPFLLQILGAVSLTAFLSLQTGRRAVGDLAVQLRQEFSSRINQHLDTYIQSARQISEMNGAAIEMKLLNPNDLQGMGRLFWRQMHLYNVGYINAVSGNNFIAAGRLFPNSPITIDELSPGRYQDKDVHSYRTDAQGNRLKAEIIGTNYDFTQEPWYQRTLAEGKPTWTLYQWEVAPYYLSLAASYPVYDSHHRLIAISWVEQRLWEINNFLQQLKISPSGRSFILGRDGMLIASSSAQPPFVVVGDKPQRIHGVDSSDPLIKATSAHLTQHFNIQQINQPQQVEFTLSGERQYVQVTPWRDQWGLSWLVVVVVPESDFMGQINTYIRTTLILCLVALIIAVVLGVYTSRWIARPILQLSYVSRSIAEGHLDQSIETTGVIRELYELGTSFARMAEQLQTSFRALEKANTELEQTNATLETHVQQRTEQLTQALAELQQAQTQLIQTEKMSSLGQMVAGIAHEVNNPVNFIHGNLYHAQTYIDEMLELLNLYRTHHPSSPPEIKDYEEEIDIEFLSLDLPKILDSMGEGTKRIQAIVSSLRNFSRLDESSLKPAEIHEGIESTLLILQHRLKPRNTGGGIEIVKRFAELPLVECYPGALNQVLLNLIANAIDAIEQRYGETSVASDRGIIEIITEATLTHVKIHIQDNGTGIPESVRARLFDPFFTTKSVGKGTGLGLSISYQIIVEQHHGSLYCTSELGVGTRFTIVIPIQQLS